MQGCAVVNVACEYVGTVGKQLGCTFLVTPESVEMTFSGRSFACALYLRAAWCRAVMPLLSQELTPAVPARLTNARMMAALDMDRSGGQPNASGALIAEVRSLHLERT